MREWRRTLGRDIAESHGKENAGAAGLEEDAETIAAYFELHGLSSTTGLIASEIEHVRTTYVFPPAPRLPRGRMKTNGETDHAPSRSPSLRPAS